MAEFKLLSTVALLEDMEREGLRRGQVGTIVELLWSDVYEVEFSDDDGRAYAIVALSESQLLPLYHQPASRAA